MVARQRRDELVSRVNASGGLHCAILMEAVIAEWVIRLRARQVAGTPGS